jgi:hypothetical protein
MVGQHTLIFTEFVIVSTLDSLQTIIMIVVGGQYG